MPNIGVNRNSAAHRTLRVVPLLVAIATTFLGLAFPSARLAAATDPLTLTPVADAWVNHQRPDSNYGSVARLRTASGASESILRFSVSGWSGKLIGGLTLTIDGINGNAATLVADQTTNGWKEASVNWRSRPSALRQLGRSPLIDGGTASFDVAALFPTGVVDRNSVWLRVRNTSTTGVTFGSRESQTKPRLSLTVAASLPGATLRPSADTWADSAAPSRAHPSATYLVVDGQPRNEAFVMFDLADRLNQRYSKLELQLRIRTSGGVGVSVSRVSQKWSESTLTWKNRPATLAPLAQLAVTPVTGTFRVDITAAFSARQFDSTRLALRISTTNSRGFDFSSREGPSAPKLLITAETPAPTAIPSATATTPASPTPPLSPTPPPTPPPTGTPTAPPSASPTAVPTVPPSSQPSPSSCPTPSPEPLFYFTGLGTDHGVGMSQQGAKGRAVAGQTYDQILTFYYTGVDFTTIDGTKPIRVLLGDSFWPTPTEPARVTAMIGGWQSAAFPGTIFPVGSYVEMWPTGPIPSPSPSPSPTPDPSPSPTPSDGCPPTPSPSPSPTSSPTPTPTATPTIDPGFTPSPTPDPSTSPIPTPIPDPWIANVYAATGALLATATTNDLLVEAADPEGVLYMAYRDELAKYKTYRGQIRLLVTGTGLETINILPLESYLRGVVPAEVPASWPIEAVKAQAVAARTYAWSRLKVTREWDVRPTAANQVYGGYQHEESRSDLAITATQNLVLTYQGKVISALYHAASGGYTENSEYAFVNERGDPGNVIPYLRGKPDVDANGVAYDSTAGSYSWATGEFTMAQLSQILGVNPQTDVGEIYTITYSRGVSGRVYCVVLVGSEGTKQLSGGRFKNVFNDNKLSGKNIKSTMYYLTPFVP